MKLLKKNQVIIYVIAIMLMTAGYFNYSTNKNIKSVETSMQIENKDDTQLADIGDAKLVSSNDIVGEEKTDINTVNSIEEKGIMINGNEEENSNKTVENNTINLESIQSSMENNDDYFVKFKLERDSMYSEIIETYEKILNSSSSLETQKQIATQEIQKINETKNSIMICENLIKTKGFENIIIFENKESINVIIGKEEIKQEEIAQIQNIITREMKANIENIHISTK